MSDLAAGAPQDDAAGGQTLCPECNGRGVQRHGRCLEEEKLQRVFLGHSRLPIISWCITCDGELTIANGEIGPFNHQHKHPDHYVIQVNGRLDIYRPKES